MNDRPNHGLHIVLAILTGGLWLIPYVFILLAQSGRRAQEAERRVSVQRAMELAYLAAQRDKAS